MRFRTIAIAGSMAFLLFFFIARPESRPQSLLRDFNAFYCAGETIVNGADPYRNEPLGTCERSAQRPDFLERAPAYLAVPAPLPGYALAPFALLALLPYAAAACAWTFILLASFVLTIRWLCALTTLPLPVIVAALALSDGYLGVTLGQIAPIAIAAVVGVAYADARGKAVLAACAGAGAMLEPHIGLPACLALAFLRPRTIVPLAALAMLLAGVSVALIGMPANIEYFTHVIGAHALSEALNVKQLSLTALLVRSGLPALLAVRIGALWFAAMIVVGIVIGQRAACRLGRPALAVLLPVAFAMIGGPFVHIAQIAGVVPAALLLVDTRRSPPAHPWTSATLAHPARRSLPAHPWTSATLAHPARRADTIAALSILMLAVPWPQFATLGTSFPIFAALAVGTLAYYLLPDAPAWKIAPPLLALVLTLAPTQLVAPIADPTARLLAAYDPHALAQSSWSAYVAAVGTQDRVAYDVARVPTLLGLLSFSYAAFRIMRATGAG